MEGPPPGELKISTQPQGGCDNERLSAAPSRLISAKDGIDCSGRQSPQHNPPKQDIPSTNEQKPLDPSGDPSAFLTEEEIRKFQEIHKTRFGREITPEEAYEKGVKLVRLMELIYQPMTHQEYQRLQERRKDTPNP
jgi:hypothetical protein